MCRFAVPFFKRVEEESGAKKSKVPIFTPPSFSNTQHNMLGLWSKFATIVARSRNKGVTWAVARYWYSSIVRDRAIGSVHSRHGLQGITMNNDKVFKGKKRPNICIFVVKLKTHSGAAKRLYPTSNGNLKRWKVGRRHLNSGFSAERINRLGKSTYLHGAQKKTAHKLMPYSR